MSRYRFSIDLGETFTDFVILDDTGRLSIKKIPTTIHDSIHNLVEDLRYFVMECKIEIADIEALVVGISVQMPPDRAINCARDLEQQLLAAGWPSPLQLVTNHGQLLRIHEAAENPEAIMSPRIGGLMTGRYFGEQMEQKNLVVLRIGGASAFLSLQTELSARSMDTLDQSLEKYGLSLPIGGNSYIGLNDKGEPVLQPEHATPGPGPACFDRGGDLPTLTDADLVLGYLNKDYFLYGAIPLKIELAKKAILKHLATPLNISVEEAAMRVSSGVDATIADHIRKLTGAHTRNLESYSLLAFGGAGPVHACEIARLVGISQMVVPVGAGVSSALGYLLVLSENDPDWQIPKAMQRAGYYNPTRRLGDFYALKGYRSVYYEKDLTPCGCPIYDRAGIRSDDTLSGPAIIEGPETTVVMREKSYARMDAFRNLRISMR
ncbi:hydantoinase/oxoprolinase-like protein [Larkinella arboricola]|uniref:Hydantoinase/oxoprolinase-like protein n=1 Tax=Larkinella arboricola TaxID=643671 RepID=A0A327X9H2_LARAB|nr:hydantoinase/oxoprolinase family protein [Larkinella arboricola]RAK00317.1 hydantoinase/oxoprolinase-like protein [Larkinella arboricola]